MNDLPDKAITTKASEKIKYISESGYASIVYLIVTMIPAAIASMCESIYGETCTVAYPLRSLYVLLWLISPGAAFIIWVRGHKLYSKAQDKYGTGSLRIIWSIALALYLIYANKYAGDLVNELFKVDSGHFGISVATFSLFYALLELYSSNIAKGMADFYAPYKLFVLAVSLVFGFIVIIKIIYDTRKEKNTKATTPTKIEEKESKLSNVSLIFILLSAWACYSVFLARHSDKSLSEKEKEKEKEKEHIALATACGIALYVSMWLYVSVYFVQNIEQSLKGFIVWTDFSENHRCNDAWLQRAKGVVFLDGSNVLALIEPEPVIYERFVKPFSLVAGPCTYPSLNEAHAPF